MENGNWLGKGKGKGKMAKGREPIRFEMEER
jgi:hypothetical protein